jgi:hypothetical protein
LVGATALACSKHESDDSPDPPDAPTIDERFARPDGSLTPENAPDVVSARLLAMYADMHATACESVRFGPESKGECPCPGGGVFDFERDAAPAGPTLAFPIGTLRFVFRACAFSASGASGTIDGDATFVNDETSVRERIRIRVVKTGTDDQRKVELDGYRRAGDVRRAVRVGDGYIAVEQRSIEPDAVFVRDRSGSWRCVEAGRSFTCTPEGHDAPSMVVPGW